MAAFENEYFFYSYRFSTNTYLHVVKKFFNINDKGDGLYILIQND